MAQAFAAGLTNRWSQLAAHKGQADLCIDGLSRNNGYYEL